MNKKYLMDDEPVTASELIKQASSLDETFANDWLKSTSKAANILRLAGYTVGENTEHLQSKVYQGNQA